MWADNETDVDFLNFTGVAETVSEIILQASGAPVSIGLSGAWGTGKSSMVRLVANDLEARTRRENEASPFIFASFNPWLYQGFDDARAALLEVVARKLEAEARARQSGASGVAGSHRKMLSLFRSRWMILWPCAACRTGTPTSSPDGSGRRSNSPTP